MKRIGELIVVTELDRRHIEFKCALQRNDGILASAIRNRVRKLGGSEDVLYKMECVLDAFFCSKREDDRDCNEHLIEHLI